MVGTRKTGAEGTQQAHGPLPPPPPSTGTGLQNQHAAVGTTPTQQAGAGKLPGNTTDGDETQDGGEGQSSDPAVALHALLTQQTAEQTRLITALRAQMETQGTLIETQGAALQQLLSSSSSSAAGAPQGGASYHEEDEALNDDLLREANGFGGGEFGGPRVPAFTTADTHYKDILLDVLLTQRREASSLTLPPSTGALPPSKPVPYKDLKDDGLYFLYNDGHISADMARRPTGQQHHRQVRTVYWMKKAAARDPRAHALMRLHGVKEMLGRYTTKIDHVAGKKNVHPDKISRLPSAEIAPYMSGVACPLTCAPTLWTQVGVPSLLWKRVIDILCSSTPISA